MLRSENTQPHSSLHLQGFVSPDSENCAVLKQLVFVCEQVQLLSFEKPFCLLTSVSGVLVGSSTLPVLQYLLGNTPSFFDDWHLTSGGEGLNLENNIPMDHGPVVGERDACKSSSSAGCGPWLGAGVVSSVTATPKQAGAGPCSEQHRDDAHIPNGVHPSVRPERPVVLGSNLAAVGHLHRQLSLRAIHDAAKVHGIGLEMEIWDVDLSPNSDLLLMRILHDAHPENPLCHPAVETVLISWVKLDAEMKFLPYIQRHGLQGDEKH